MKNFLRNFFFVFALSCSLASAQISNPTQPTQAGTGLTLSGNSLSVNYGTSAGTALQGNTSSLTLSGTLTANGTLAGTAFSTIPQSGDNLISNTGNLAANTSAQNILAMPVATYQGGRATVFVKQTTSYQVSSFNFITDGTTVVITTPVTGVTAGTIVSFTGTVGGGNINLFATFGSGASSGKFRIEAAGLLQ